jgi:hypothetical protein
LGLSHGLLKIGLIGDVTVHDATLGEVGKETIAGKIYLNARTHLEELSEEKALFVGTKTLPTHGDVPAVTEPERSSFQWSLQSVR